MFCGHLKSSCHKLKVGPVVPNGYKTCEDDEATNWEGTPGVCNLSWHPLLDKKGAAERPDAVWKLGV